MSGTSKSLFTTRYKRMFSDRTFSNERTVRPSCQVTTHRQQQKLLNDETKISDGLIE